SSVGTYGITAAGATGSGLSNYAVTYRPGTLTIDPAALTVTALDQTSTYGQAPALGTSRFSTAGLVNGDTVSGVTLATAAGKTSSVGTYGITAAGATGSGLTNYAVTYRSGTLTIDPAALTVTALDQTSTYGTTPNLGTTAFSTTGLVNGDTVSSVSLTTAATGASSVGSYSIGASAAQGSDLANYAVTYQPGSLTIDPAALTVTALDQTSTYGQAPALGTSRFSTTGLVNGDAVSAITLATTAGKTSGVGTYGITAAGATGTGLSNYAVTYQPGTLTIDPAALTVTALDQTSTYGQAPDLGTSRFSTAGLVNGDTVSGVTLATAAGKTSSVGTYGITAAGATGSGLSNYAVTYQPGTLTIDPAALTVTALDQTSTYGTTPNLGTTAFSTTGLVNGDTVSSVSLTTAATGASSVGSYGIGASAAQGSDLANYAVTYQPGTLTIDPAALTVTALDQTSTYGQAPALGTSRFSTAGLVNGDTVSGVTLATTGGKTSSVGTYGITAAGATGSGLSNYAVTYRPGTLTIDPAALTVTALDQTSTYGQAPALGTSRFSTIGLVNGDAVSAVTLATTAGKTSSVGTYGITAAGATGSGLSNYAVTYRPGTLTIDPAAL
ncbi:MBG-2 domain-containing protein, partial [Gluconacetobacter sp. 1c LMG 22058]